MLNFTAKLDHDGMSEPYEQSEADLTDVKFMYVVACQVFGLQKRSMHVQDRSSYLNTVRLLNKYEFMFSSFQSDHIILLRFLQPSYFKLHRHPSLRVAFIDEVDGRIENGTTEKTYYSVLVKGGTVEQV